MKFAHYLKEQEHGAPKEWQGKFLKYKALKVSHMVRGEAGPLLRPFSASLSCQQLSAAISA